MNITLTAEAERTTGTRPSRRMRRAGRIPAVVYGLGIDSAQISVPWPQLRAALNTDAGLNALISLEVGDRKDLTIVKDLQRHPIRRDVLHVDFLRIDPDARLEIEVPIELVGEAELVTREGGVVEHLLYSMMVSARPNEIPTSVEVDITNLTLDMAITVSEIALPAGVEAITDGEEAIVTSFVPRGTDDGTESETAAEGGADGSSADGTSSKESGKADDSDD